ncbi:D-ribose pyranase [Alkalibacterium iburiense]|uniref:D-ribose pyranase n=1 Tax=Alkalibacterium iburiense TaxID=290589 RepID=A0ABN0XA78_9LACT
MKKHGILNSEISKVLTDLGHTDQIIIADCGLPVPDGIKKIDLALKFGTPSFMDVLKEIMKDMKVEHAILAEEIKDQNAEVFAELSREFKKESITQTFISHEEFKKASSHAKVIIRTGEVTPYANVILQAGVLF